jgi:hypothetical protein
MSRLVIPILVAALGIDSFGSARMFAQTQPRKILYSPRVPIADRLLPDDKAVLIYKEAPAPYVLDPRAPRPTYEQEIQNMREGGDIIALVRVANVEGELIEQGTWIRTIVRAHINQLAQSNVDLKSGDSIEFTFSGGNTRISDVDVTAGSSPRFVQGEQYLVVLVSRPRISLGSAFHVTPAGVLEPVKSITGVAQSFRTNLFGRNISEVLQALSGR